MVCLTLSSASVDECLQRVKTLETLGEGSDDRRERKLHVVDEAGSREVAIVAVAQEEVEVEPLLDPDVTEKRSVHVVYQGAFVQPMRSA